MVDLEDMVRKAEQMVLLRKELSKIVELDTHSLYFDAEISGKHMSVHCVKGNDDTVESFIEKTADILALEMEDG